MQSSDRDTHEPSQNEAIHPVFRLVFLTVLGLTATSMGVCVLLSLAARQTDPVRQLIETCSTTFKLGFGAIVGLLGGKAIGDNTNRQENGKN